MSYELSTNIALGGSKTGLTLSASLFDKTKTLLSSGISYNFYEVGNGNYLWTYNGFTDGFRGECIIHQSGMYPGGSNVLAAFSINPEEVENSDVKTSSLAETVTGANAIDIISKDEDGGIVGNTIIEIYPSGVGSLIGKNYSNMSTGKASFGLDNGDYRAYLYNPSLVQWSNPTYLHITSDTTIEVSGVRLSPALYSTPGSVRLYAYVTDLGLTMQGGVEMIVTPSGAPVIVNSVIVSERPIIGISDSNGYVYTTIGSNIPVRIKVPKGLYDRYTITPASGSVNIATL